MSSSTKSVQAMGTTQGRSTSQSKRPRSRPGTPVPLESAQTNVERSFKNGLEFLARGVETLNRLRDRLGAGSSKAREMINSSLDLFKQSVQEFASCVDRLVSHPATDVIGLQETKRLLEEFRAELEVVKSKNRELSFLLAQKQRDSRDKHLLSGAYFSNEGTHEAFRQQGQQWGSQAGSDYDSAPQQDDEELEGELQWRGVEEQATFGPRSHEVLLNSYSNQQTAKPPFQPGSRSGTKKKSRPNQVEELGQMFGLSGTQDDMTFGRKGRERELQQKEIRGLPEELMRSLLQINPGLGQSMGNEDSFLERQNQSDISGHLGTDVPSNDLSNSQLKNSRNTKQTTSTGKRTPQRALALSTFDQPEPHHKTFMNSAGKLITPTNGRLPTRSAISSGTRSQDANSEDHPQIQVLQEDLTHLDSKLQQLLKQIVEEVQDLQ